MSRRGGPPPEERAVRSVAFFPAVEERYGRYARAVLGNRHFAEGRDGLLPVQRRALWSMHKLGAVSRASSTKTSKATGFTTGNFHPHGDGSVAGSIANMTQASMRCPLVIGIGSFGRHDAPPSAPRYTSAYLAPYTLSMMDPSELAQVPMDPTYDGKGVEPRYLPARLPHLLIGGCQSIAVGYAGHIPPCSIDWVLDAVRRTTRGRRLVAPNTFAHRWGGTLLHLDDTWLATGRASARFAPTVVADRARVLVTSLAPGLSASRVATLMTRSPDLSSVSEETAQQGEVVRLVCTVRRGGDVTRLFEHAQKVLVGLAQSYSFLHIHQFDTPKGVDYRPIVEGPERYLRRWVAWRTTVVVGAAKWRVDRHNEAIARLRLMIRAIERRRDLVAALDAARSRADLTVRVRAILRCSVEEADRVCDMQLHRLAAMNVAKLSTDVATHLAEIAREQAIASAPGARLIEDAERTHALGKGGGRAGGA